MKFDIERCTEDSLILKRLPGYGDIEYVLIGCDLPTEEEPQMKFWQEFGYTNGECESRKIEATETEKQAVEQWLKKEKENAK